MTVSENAFMSTSTRAQRAAGDRGPRRLALDCAAHVFEHVDERHVSLNARGAQPFDGDRTPGERGQGEEVAGGRCVGLDGVFAAL